MTMELNTILFNKFGPPLFIIVHISTGVYGVLVALPTLYESQSTLFFMQITACFGIIQLIICWYITKKIDSSYKPEHPFPIQKTTKEGEVVNNYSRNGRECQSMKDEHKRDATYSGLYDNDSSSSQSPAYQDALNFKINVATTGMYGVIEKKLFPYWSWIPCFKCQMLRPPRCHHCPLCQKCILKRDHHCFFTGTCIGVRNQGYFIVFAFWAAFVTIFGTIHMIPYTYLEILPMISYFDFVIPISIARVTFGYTPVCIPFLLVLFWTVLILTALSIVTFYEILKVTVKGTTKFEMVNKIKVTDCRSLSDRWCDTLGARWLLSFLFPFLISTKNTEDALLWPHIKP